MTNMLTVAFTVPPIVADTGTAELSDDSSTIQEADGDDPSNPTDSQDSFLNSKNYDLDQNEEGPKPSSVDEDKWDFNKTNEWADFANIDGDSAELVIGINNAKPNSYAEVTFLIAENGGKSVNTVSMGDEIRAVVADIPLMAVSSFVTEVRDAGLSRYIEPNMKFQACFVPNDPYWPLQWGPAKIEADYAWDTTIGDPSVLVAVVDTGIDWNHPDLAANYVPLGYDWVNNDPDPMDDDGHGTHCAGIIAADTNNSIGIAGLAQVRIMAEKGLNWKGMGTEDDLANAIGHAVDQEADILSLSWGSYVESAAIYEAIKYALDAGVLVVAAAGNDATSIKHFPAAHVEVIAVSATDEYDNPVWWTNFGDWVELAAPGVNIYSTVWDDSYTYMSGTSMSTPHVAGVAALILSQFPNMTQDQLRLQLRYTADDLGLPGFDEYYGYGRVNARRAVEEAPPDHDLLILDWERPPYVEPGDEATVSTTVFNFGVSNESDITVQLLVNGSVVDNATIGFLASGESATVNCSWSPTVEGMYNVTSYVLPMPSETVMENNVVWAYVYVGFPLKAFVLDSAGNDLAEIITNWQVLNTNWYVYGSTMIYVDYTTLDKDDITYDDIVATGADVLIISCAYDWEFTNSEIDAITQYVYEGHGLIATAGTLYYWVPNNNKLAPLFGLNETVTWDATGTDLLHLVDPTHPLFANIPDPFVFADVVTAVPSDWRWDENELVGGTYFALGHYQESAIVVFRGLVYISPWLEIMPPYYHFHLQLLYNAITWSTYQKPEHELVVSLECPPYLEPGESTLLNATVANMGLNNETDVELYLSIDSSVVNSTTISELLTEESYTINYSWTPTAEATYNVTAYTPPVPGEDFTTNNWYTKFTRVTYAVIIGIIETHGETLHTEELDNYYGSLGHIVERITTTITPGVLENYDIIVVGEDWEDTPWLPSEIAAVQAFIGSGRGFVAIGDELAPSVQEILGTYGISYTGIGASSGSSSNFDPLHPIMQGVSLIYAGSPVNSLQITAPAYWIANDVSDKYILIAGAEVGGYVLCLSNDFPYYLYDYDNEIMFKNIVDWMTRALSLRDVAIISVVTSATEVYEGQIVNITVVAINEGNMTETFDVATYYDSGVIEIQTVTNLTVGANVTLTFSWNTTGVRPCVNYAIKAVASLVPGETDRADNTYIDGTVKVKMVGDLNGDGIVDIFDAIVLSAAFGSYPGHPRWDQLADLNNDSIIDIFDAIILASNFGRCLPPLPEMTTVYVDPPLKTVAVGSTFTVNVNIYNVTNLAGYEFKLFYDTTVLDGLDVTLPPGHFLTPLIDPENLWILVLEIDDAYNATHGRVFVAVTYYDLYPEPPKSGSGTLVTISFKATAPGSSALRFDRVKLADPKARPIPCVVVDGYVLITSATSTTSVTQGKPSVKRAPTRK